MHVDTPNGVSVLFLKLKAITLVILVTSSLHLLLRSAMSKHDVID